MYDDSLDPALRQRAAIDLLNRAGLGQRNFVEVEVKPWAHDIEGLLVDLGDDEAEPVRNRRGGAEHRRGRLPS